MLVKGVLSGYSRRPAKYAVAENTKKIDTAEAARGPRATVKNAATPPSAAAPNAGR
jgi:hypothetical protein